MPTPSSARIDHPEVLAAYEADRIRARSGRGIPDRFPRPGGDPRRHGELYRSLAESSTAPEGIAWKPAAFSRSRPTTSLSPTWTRLSSADRRPTDPVEVLTAFPYPLTTAEVAAAMAAHLAPLTPPPPRRPSLPPPATGAPIAGRWATARLGAGPGSQGLACSPAADFGARAEGGSTISSRRIPACASGPVSISISLGRPRRIDARLHTFLLRLLLEPVAGGAYTSPLTAIIVFRLPLEAVRLRASTFAAAASHLLQLWLTSFTPSASN